MPTDGGPLQMSAFKLSNSYHSLTYATEEITTGQPRLIPSPLIGVQVDAAHQRLRMCWLYPGRTVGETCADYQSLPEQPSPVIVPYQNGVPLVPVTFVPLQDRKGLVCVALTDSFAHCMDAATGALVWSFALPPLGLTSGGIPLEFGFIGQYSH
jgi:hypothetical protein